MDFVWENERNLEKNTVMLATTFNFNRKMGFNEGNFSFFTNFIAEVTEIAFCSFNGDLRI